MKREGENSMKKVLIWKDTEQKGVHPVEAVCGELVKIAEEIGYQAELRSFPNGFSYEDLKPYDIFAFYGGDELDAFMKDKAIVPPLFTYVANGGGLCVFHEGLRVADIPEMANLMGGMINRYDEPGQVEYKLLHLDPLAMSQGQVEHVIAAESHDFTVMDQPGWFYVDIFSAFDQVLRYKIQDYEMYDVIAGWVNPYAHGRTAFLSPGHFAEVFSAPDYRIMVKRTFMWLTKELNQPAEDYYTLPDTMRDCMRIMGIEK